VVEVLLSRDELLGVAGGHEEAAALLVGEELDRESGEPVCLLEPAQPPGRDVQLAQAARDVGVVLEAPRNRRAALAPGPKQPPVRRGEPAEQEVSEPLGGM